AEKQKAREREFEADYLQRLAKVVRRADRVLNEKVKTLTAQPADARKADEVAAVLPELAAARQELAGLADVFIHLRRYQDKAVEEARETGKDYRSAAADYCRLVKRCLGRENWTDADDAAIKEKAAEVERLRKKLGELF